MKRFRVRLNIIFVMLIGLSVLAAGLYAGQLIKDAYTQALEMSMKREIDLVLASSDWTKTGDSAAMTAYYSGLVKRYTGLTGARITFVDAGGSVLGDSDYDPATMDNHLLREEIVEAGGGAFGSSIRHSSTQGENMMYVAKAVRSGGQQSGYLRLAMSLNEVDASIRRYWMFLLAGLLAFFAIAGVASYRIARGLTRPLEKITRVAQQFTDANYRSRVDAGGRHDEIGQLGEAINRMADSLQQQVQRIGENESRLTSVLDNMMSGILMIGRDERIMLVNRAAEEFLGFTAEELLGRQYMVANQQFEFTEMIKDCMDTHEAVRDEAVFYFPEERILEVSANPMTDSEGEWAGVLVVLHNITAVRRLERMRSEFVANVSHELKTPVAAVKGFAETLLAGALDDRETARSFLQIIFDESERLNRLIGDILELSKIESRRIPLNFSPVYLNDFVESSLRMMKAEADRKNIALEMEVPAELCIEADEDRLRQIVVNLLANGISYTPEGGRVRVSAALIHTDPADPADPSELPAADNKDRIRLSIADTGIGIPRKDIPRIFERFYRVDKARSRSSGGTGLGLSIVKHLVELHNGTISVESEVGTGSTFLIELPVIHK